MCKLLFSNNVVATLNDIIEGGNYNHVAVLVDENTRCYVLPLLDECLSSASVIEIAAGDENKSFDSLVHVWQELERCGATRQSLLVNLGGGMVTDLGGLAAATFKRGMSFVNVPTTLLAAVDAAVGGKTGINFMGLKNEIGVFARARAVIVSTCFFGTLPSQELKSGFGEMLKHSLLSGKQEFERLVQLRLDDVDPSCMLELVEESVAIKAAIVAQDPTEGGLRKALNLGHTVGHALESFALEQGKPVPHGWAVAWGLVAELVLSHLKLGFPSSRLYSLARLVRELYGATGITCDHYERLIEIMRHDKKSHCGEINCTLLKECGDYLVDNVIEEAAMKNALDIMRDLLGE